MRFKITTLLFAALTILGITVFTHAAEAQDKGTETGQGRRKPDCRYDQSAAPEQYQLRCRAG